MIEYKCVCGEYFESKDTLQLHFKRMGNKMTDEDIRNHARLMTE